MLAAHSTWPQIAAATNTIAILPVGSCEQHGPHLPLSTDTIIAERLSQAVAEQLNATVFPALSYGYRSNPFSGGGPLFPGTVDLSAVTLINLATDIVQELIHDGFERILIINAHFENQFALQEAMILADAASNHRATIVQTNWWDPLPQEVIEQVFAQSTFPGWALEHAAVTETSLMAYLAPELVRLDKLPVVEGFVPPTYIRVPNKPTDIPSHGALADASAADAAKGQLLFNAAVAGIVEICATECGSTS